MVRFLQGNKVSSFGLRLVYWLQLAFFVIYAYNEMTWLEAESTAIILATSILLIILSAVWLAVVDLTFATVALILMFQLSYLSSNAFSRSNLILVSVYTLSLLATMFGSIYLRHQTQESELSKQEQAIANRLQRLRLQALINSTADAVIATDEYGKVDIYNGATLDLLDINASLEETALGEHMKVVDQEGRVVDLLEEASNESGYLNSREYSLDFGENDKVNLDVSISPVKIAFGEQASSGSIVILRDITREKSLEDERDEFISVISHELRTPVAIAEGSLSNAKLVAKKSTKNKVINDSLDAAYQQVVFLSDMINDLSTLSRAERGVLKEAPEDVNLNDLVESLAVEYKVQAGAKGLKIKTSVGKTPHTVHTSRLYAKEILQNFVTNAIKYTPKGTVTITVKKAGENVQVSVTDKGIGISKADQKRLFDKFFRSEDYRTRESNGTGLGLYVTAKLARLIGADIELESTLNKGSTFTVTFTPVDDTELEIA